MAYTRISDVVVPEIYTPYNRLMTEEKSRFVQSGIVARSPMLDNLLSGGGLTFNVPMWNDLPTGDGEDVATDDPTQEIVPTNIGTKKEIAVRMTRAKAWAAANLASQLAGSDPMMAIAARTSDWWARRLQLAVLSVLSGVFADNDAVPTGTEHVRYDLTYDISGSAFVNGVTTFSAEAFIDTCLTAGDSAEDFTACAMHSVVYARMQKNNLIDFIPDSNGVINIPTFLGRRVVVDDGMPNPTTGVYHTYLFGPGAIQWGMTTPDSPEVEFDRKPMVGNGFGADVMINRVCWTLHPIGHAWAASATANGGPSNANSSNNLAHASSWTRVFPERKQIKIARLITRES